MNRTDSSVSLMGVPTRAVVEQYLSEYEDRADAIAALVADFPALEKQNAMHKRPNIELVLNDLESYRRGN